MGFAFVLIRNVLIHLLLGALVIDAQRIQTFTASLLYDIRGVAVDSSNNLYAADYSNTRILKFDPNGTQIATFTTSSITLNINPYGLAVDRSNNMYVADTYHSRVVKFSPNGTLLSFLTTTNPILNYPFGVAVDPSDNVYVTDDLNNRIVVFGPNGTQISGFTVSLSNPWGIAADGSNNVYANDVGNNRVVKYAPDGTVIQVFATDNPILNYPIGVAVDRGNNVYVADAGRNRIVKFSANGTQLAVLTTTNPALDYPWGVAVDTGNNVYVSDTHNNRIVVYYFQLCPLGYYCTGLNSTATLCPAGYYCPSQYVYAAEIDPCQIGTYCPNGTSTPLICPIGSYCPFMSIYPTRCPPATLCNSLNQSTPLLCPANIDCTLNSGGVTSASLQQWQTSLSNQTLPTSSFAFCYSTFNTAYGGNNVFTQGILSTTQLWNSSSTPFLPITGITGTRTYLSANGTLNQTVQLTGIGVTSLQSIIPDNGLLANEPYLTLNGLEYLTSSPMYPYLLSQVQIYASTNLSYQERFDVTNSQVIPPHQSNFGFRYSVILATLVQPSPVCPTFIPQAYYFCYHLSGADSAYEPYNMTANGLLLTFNTGSNIYAMIDATGSHTSTRQVTPDQSLIYLTTIIGIQRSLPPTISSPYAEQFINLNTLLPVDSTGISFILNTSTPYPNGVSYPAVRIASSTGLLYETYQSDSSLSFGSSGPTTQFFVLYQYSPYINQGLLPACSVVSQMAPLRPIGGPLIFADPSQTRIGQYQLTSVTGNGAFSLTNQVYFQFIPVNATSSIVGLGIRLNDYSQNTTLKLAIYNASVLLGTSQPMILISETISFTVPPQPGPNLVVELPLKSVIVLNAGTYGIAVSGVSKSQSISYVCCRSSLTSLNPADALQSLPTGYKYGISGFNDSGLSMVTTAGLQNLGLDNLQLPLWVITDGKTNPQYSSTSSPGGFGPSSTGSTSSSGGFGPSSTESTSSSGGFGPSSTESTSSSGGFGPSSTESTSSSGGFGPSSTRSASSLTRSASSSSISSGSLFSSSGIPVPTSLILIQCNLTVSSSAWNVTLVSFTISVNSINFSSLNATSVIQQLLSNFLANGSIQSCFLSNNGHRRLLQSTSSQNVYLLLTNIPNDNTQAILREIVNGTLTDSIGAQLVGSPSLTIISESTSFLSGTTSVWTSGSTGLTSGSTNASNTLTSGTGPSIGAIIGGVVGGVTGLCCIIIVFGVCMRYSRHKSSLKSSSSQDASVEMSPTQIEHIPHTSAPPSLPRRPQRELIQFPGPMS